ncbi:MAG: hypothetical protein HY808_04690 [Nitrospirae bacterium]|nr:hypothetical protein [Nitrospirota bacterium]
MKDKVVITGFGLVSSLGPNASETWDALLSGKSGAAQVPELNPAELGIHPRDARIMDKHAHMLLKSSQDSFRHSRLDTSSIPKDDIGFFAGMGMVDYNIDDLLPAVVKSLDAHGSLDYDAFYSGAFQEIYPLWPLSMLNNISFCQAAINLGIKGESAVFSPHADSGAQAIMEGLNTIIEKKAQAVLAGGVSEKSSPLSLARASLSGILNTSSENNPPLKKGAAGGFFDEPLCRPFGGNRTGTILGEGCGVVTLELLSSAKKRQVPYFAAITGYASAFGKSDEYNCPASAAISNAMEQALIKAGLAPSDIDLIIAHGDGTRMGDANEIEAIHHTFSDCINKVNVFSSKGALGHMLAGAPAVDIILGTYILENGIIPAVHNSLPPDKNIRFNLVNKGPLKTTIKRIVVNSFSYEGQCASLIIEALD